MENSGMIHILTGEDAVRCFEEEGAEACLEQGFNCVEVISYDESTTPEDLVREVLLRTNGQLASIVISEEDADIIINGDSNIVRATYVSVWDGGREVRTACEYNKRTTEVSEVQSVDVEGLDILDEEYIELDSGEVIKTFINEDGNNIVDGQLED